MYVTFETIITAGGVLGAVVSFVALVWKLFTWVNHQKEQDAEIERIKNQHKEETERLRGEIEAVRAELNETVEKLRQHHEDDIRKISAAHEESMKTIQEELTLLVYGQLACLNGLAEQGCDGPVTTAIDKIEKHINKRAHGLPTI